MDYGTPQIALPRLTPGVKLLLLINVGVFLFAWLFGIISGGDTLQRFFAVSWDGLFDYFGLGLLRLITYQFVHDYYGVLHLAMNMIVLYFFGTFVEGEVGKRGIIRLYLAAGVVGAVVQMALGLAVGRSMSTVGASGACYGIMVYAAFMAPRMRVIFLIFPIEMRWLVGGLVFIGVYSTTLVLSRQADGGVAHGAHLGGALWGFIAFRYLRRFYRGADFRKSALVGTLQRWRARRRQRAAAERRAILDQLLEKVQEQGMSSLTGAERRFLERASREMRDR